MRLDTETRGFILYLEQAGILTPESRELVLDRILALDDHEVDLDTVKWVILMVLFNRPGEEEAYTWMENLMFDVPTHLVH
jgi:Smg protein